MSRTPEHRAWEGMLTRCRNSARDDFPRYGGRGIDFDPRWEAFEAFFADMGLRPTAEHSIERIDNSLGYWPQNCRWATRIEQANNRRNNRLLTHRGKTMTLANWARETGLGEGVIEKRLNLLGWTDARALDTPHRGWGPGKTKV